MSQTLRNNAIQMGIDVPCTIHTTKFIDMSERRQESKVKCNQAGFSYESHINAYRFPPIPKDHGNRLYICHSVYNFIIHHSRTNWQSKCLKMI